MNTQNSLPNEWIERIFMRLHGRFGNTFFNKYKTGDLNANGEDAGIVNAKATWAYELRGLTTARIKAGLEANYDRTPDCDLFKSKCVLQTEHHDFVALPKKLSDEELESNKKKLEQINTNLTKRHSRDWVAYWKCLLNNKSGVPEITLTVARQALINLGHPYEAVNG